VIATFVSAEVSWFLTLFATSVVITESEIYWIPDLIQPDPWYGLPIVTGIVFYLNMEVAFSRRSFSGEAVSKSQGGSLLKDIMQTVALLYPGVLAQVPAGMQIYVLTSFLYTTLQTTALRTESVRLMIGLPSLLAPPPEPKYTHRLVKMANMRRESYEAWKGNVQGIGVMNPVYPISFPGTDRPTTIEFEKRTDIRMPPIVIEALQKRQKVPFVNGVMAPMWQLRKEQEEQEKRAEMEKAAAAAAAETTDTREYMPRFSDEVMEKANRGEKPTETVFFEESEDTVQQGPTKLNAKKKRVKGTGPKRNKRK
jgi:hypothetical protein